MIAQIHITPESTVAEAEEQYFNFIKAFATKMGSTPPDEKIRETAKEVVKRQFGYLNCPLVNTKIQPVACMFCSMGHMTECHHPYVCSDPRSKCNHYGDHDSQEDPKF